MEDRDRLGRRYDEPLWLRVVDQWLVEGHLMCVVSVGSVPYS